MTLAKRLTVAVAGLLLTFGLVLPPGAHAQMEDEGSEATIKIGPRIGLPVGDLSDAGTLFFGAEGRADLGDLPVVANASFDYYLTDIENTTYFAVDLNALYEFGIENQSFVPYAGGGLGITRVSFETQGVDIPGGGTVGGTSSSETEIGLNLVGGARFPVGSIEPFAQLNITLGDTQRVGITGGLLFGF
ncbi:MAG: outer membrane beta-barrel protein [Salinibacter sp.]|uniref:outer membrane beta-barrel protein n=1 Tax=Salinibacter sp. TaxID=2065818 RepID=UPI0035D3FBB3